MKRRSSMVERAPTRSKNLGGDDFAEIPWERVAEKLRARALDSGETILSTTRPDGRPHAMKLGAIWVDGNVYFQTGTTSQKARNLRSNPACSITATLPGIDVSFEGLAVRVSDQNELEAVANHYREHGWP